MELETAADELEHQLQELRSFLPSIQESFKESIVSKLQDLTFHFNDILAILKREDSLYKQREIDDAVLSISGGQEGSNETEEIKLDHDSSLVLSPHKCRENREMSYNEMLEFVNLHT